MQIPYLPARSRKLPRVIGGSIGSREEIWEVSGLPNPMVPRLHRCNGYIKRKLPASRVQKCIALVGVDTELTSAWPQTTRVIGGRKGSREEICEISGLPNPVVPRFNQCNGYIKRKLPAWRVQKCNTLVGVDTVLTSAGPQTTPCHGGQYRVQRGNLRNFGPTKPHGTAFAPIQWLYEKEATGIESSKMYCPGRCRYRTYPRGAVNYTMSRGAV